MSVAIVVANVALVLALEAGVAAPAPGAGGAPKAEILGLWKGTSTCTKVEGNEFCRDETIVYNFIEVQGQPATVSLKAARIVDGVVIRAFNLYVTYRPEKGQWTGEFDRDGGRAVWAYVVSGDALTGTGMLLPDLTIVRNVTAMRTTKDQVPAR